MRKPVWQFHSVALLIVGGILSTLAFAETIEFVTYYPAPESAGGNGWTKEGAVVRLTTATDNVGVGTATPASLINPGVNPFLDIRANAATTGAGLGFHSASSTQEAFLGMNINAGMFLDTAGNAAAANNFISFRTGDTNSSYAVTEKMRLTSAGNVGIGTALPTTKLDVAGGLRLRQNAGGNAGAALIELGDRTPGWGMGLVWNAFYDGVWKYRNSDFAGTLLLGGGGANGGDLIYLSVPSGAAGADVAFQERFRITNDGNVGIGTAAPVHRLQVETAANQWAITGVAPSSGVYGQGGSYGVYGNSPNAGVTGQGGTYGVYGAGATTGVYGTAGTHGVLGQGGYYGVYGSGTPVGVYGTSANYGLYGYAGEIGAVAEGSSYDFFAGGPGVDYGSRSSIRWKRNIQPIGQPLEKTLRLRGVYFDWDKEHGGRHDLGMIGEEVGKIFPEIVTYEANGVDATGMDYGKLTAVLVEAVKEQQEEIQALQAAVAALENQLEKKGKIEP